MLKKVRVGLLIFSISVLLILGNYTILYLGRVLKCRLLCEIGSDVSFISDYRQPMMLQKDEWKPKMVDKQFKDPYTFLLQQRRRGHELVKEYKRRKSSDTGSTVSESPGFLVEPSSNMERRRGVRISRGAHNNVKTKPVVSDSIKNEVSASSLAKQEIKVIEQGTQPLAKEESVNNVKRQNPAGKKKISPWSRSKRSAPVKREASQNDASLEKVAPVKRSAPFSNETFQLVLVTTVESFGKKQLDVATNNTFAMFSMFQKQYSFRAVIFTNSALVKRACRRFNLSFDSAYEVNPYGLPYMKYMLQRGRFLYRSEYLGYINSDILVTPNLFEALDLCKDLASKGLIKPKHEISSVVWDIYNPGIVDVSSISKYEEHLSNLVPKLRQQRDYRSADYFIFSKEVSFDDMDPVVIARIRIDNYMMGYIMNQSGSLVDATEKVIGIHQGLDGYVLHTRSKKYSDINWNVKFIDENKITKGSLALAGYRLEMDEYTKRIISRINERRNVVKLKKMTKKERRKLNLPVDCSVC